MANLLLKEWMVNRSTILLLFSLALVSFFLFEVQMPIYIAMLLGSFYPFMSGMTEYRNNNKVDTLMNSLPVKRRDIVASKYVFALLFGLGLVLTMIVLNLLLPSFEVSLLFILPLSISVMGFSAAIYYPFFYLVGARVAMYVNLVIVFISSYIIQNADTLNLENSVLDPLELIRNFSAEQLSFTLLGITIVVLLVSVFISGKIYRQKQF
ncbi:ABC-2 transporter permease [Aureibacillus halotolerans]|uniref:ABC-2 family transporter n=1 Tax=Aureibacillus halotolerans TaxID=1508390 RepID=A0A4R6U4M9_9BACI|nr:ABC-2 transporter permease [Aureibacillus halotolerans]TDQ41430.1 ABC-2 family transporter [Aureibacillus halotolerans]